MWLTFVTLNGDIIKIHCGNIAMMRMVMHGQGIVTTKHDNREINVTRESIQSASGALGHYERNRYNAIGY